MGTPGHHYRLSVVTTHAFELIRTLGKRYSAHTKFPFVVPTVPTIAAVDGLKKSCDAHAVPWLTIAQVVVYKLREQRNALAEQYEVFLTRLCQVAHVLLGSKVAVNPSQTLTIKIDRQH